MPLITFKRPVNYPLQTGVFDINSLSAIHTSSDVGADEGLTSGYQRRSTVSGIPFRKVYDGSG